MPTDHHRAPGFRRPFLSGVFASANLRLFLLVLPLLGFIIVTVIVPVGHFLARSVDNSAIADNMPLTAAALAAWQPADGTPDQAAFAAFAADIRAAAARDTLGQLAQGLNQQFPGSRTFIIRSGPLAAKLTAGAEKAELLTKFPALNDTRLWSIFKAAGSKVTDFYLLQSLDLERDAKGAIAAVTPDRAIFLAAIWRTIVISINVTLICALVALPVAHVLAAARPPYAGILLALVLFPLWTSLLVRTVSWIIILQGEGPVNTTLQFLHLIEQPLHLVYTRGSLYIAMVQVLLPLMILSILAVVVKLPKELVRAATSLGANWWQSYWRVQLPLIAPGIVTGAGIVFVFALGYYITPALIGGPQDQMLSSYVALYTNKTLNWGLAAALALQLLLVLVIALLGWAAFQNLSRRRV
ncbi:ABC transporter permease [Dongia rigui]|uniref:ABC transporter permease n=1 Tax=Dongia rigui TaxID=940149 RepID=A0ABU5E3Q9_9PROT|nr:ABC transporter permease [Dongia rigui]MDY0873543.1 ABC transporter permease [Dongia rigui]